MTASASLTIAGKLNTTTTNGITPIPLQQTIDKIEVKNNQYTIPANGTFAVPMNFSTGVTEAVFLRMWTEGKLLVSIDGGAQKGLRGLSIQTFYPDEGIAAVSIENPSDSDDVVV